MPVSQPLAYLDYLVCVGYVALLAVVVWRAGRRCGDSTEELFLGGRSVPAWAAGLSFMATALSAATFIGVPTVSFTGDLTYMASNLAAIIAAVVVAYCFLPKFYAARVQTVYGVINQRFGSSSAQACSWMFLLGRIMASGTRLFIGAVALATIINPQWGDVATISLVGVLVVLGITAALWGGIRSVIWTDVVQALLFMVAGLVTLTVLLQLIPLDIPGIVNVLSNTGDESTPNKLQIIKPDIGDYNQPYSIWAIIFGLSLLNIGVYATDQDIAQRLLTCKDAKTGARSLFIGIAANIPTVFIFLCVGLLLYVYYQRPDIMGAAAPTYGVDPDMKVFAQFIAQIE